MRLPDIILELAVREPWPRVMLDPGHAARGKIGGGAQAGLVLEHFVGDLAHLEGEARLVVLPAADGKDLAADLPDMGAAPLHDIGRRGEAAAESVELLVGHRFALDVIGFSSAPARKSTKARTFAEG